MRGLCEQVLFLCSSKQKPWLSGQSVFGDQAVVTCRGLWEGTLPGNVDRLHIQEKSLTSKERGKY